MPMIVWGKKRREYDKGRVAEWCPQCSDVKPFAVKAINMVSHVYFIPLGSGTVVGHLARCGACGFETELDMDEYGAPVLDPSADLDEVVRRTNPNIRARVAEQLALEQKLKSAPGELDPAERLEIIGSRLTGAAVRVEGHFQGGTNLGFRTGLALAATFLVPLALALYLADDGRDSEALAWQVPLGAFVLGIVVTIYLGVTAGGRWVRKKVLPPLAESLVPLEPTHEELETVLTGMREAGLKMGKKLSVQQIADAIGEVQTAPGRAGGAGGAGGAVMPG